jgi:hypothetical protein
MTRNVKEVLLFIYGMMYNSISRCEAWSRVYVISATRLNVTGHEAWIRTLKRNYPQVIENMCLIKPYRDIQRRKIKAVTLARQLYKCTNNVV